MEPTVHDVPEASRYEIRVAGELAGFAEYRLRPGILAATHTEVDPAFQGQGLAGRLVREMLADVRERSLALHPYCPLVHRTIRKDLVSYLDLVPAEDRARFRLPATAEEPASEEGPPPPAP
ncbi:hypothetical protein BH708_07255 [Brachybacterium sp. P6-10-X1]|uniref:GNAT family N-acetyltransferase n=1 Tax=Brachybacterium sp. P6-10-X1 TaxID=1903186 RepID=UPI000971BC4C|nr:hypothetical protein BH708_07255 [Brachybacterium sp. P6-10-X1]